ncbi:MAG TPA: hypothetical protein VHC49_25035 [Mycobacteriales bacterium]|nr:hypothetical protein [Mycobacteriales bacterium]
MHEGQRPSELTDPRHIQPVTGPQNVTVDPGQQVTVLIARHLDHEITIPGRHRLGHVDPVFSQNGAHVTEKAELCSSISSGPKTRPVHP